ncbi:hypothetical protein G5V58_08405 [Nocardioides anomalus]|uniref:Uncharacterized protein n=1 Tax=Nocardioides anomalus TaxID=2712223 RepID=A0A6G6WCB6_9ACTN|nr:hypothetical protein [Nocardioides anomalus]QIG42793.1 hypothetical protein G5V58_08405 [Nocardioides anomalus]
MLRLALAALLVLPVSGAAAAPRGEDSVAAPTTERVRTLAAAKDPAGDVESLTGVSAGQTRIVDLTRVELQRRGGTVQVAFTLAVPPARNGYCTELFFTASTGLHAKRKEDLTVLAIPQRDITGVALRGRTGPQDCEGDLEVHGSTVVVEVPRDCVPPPFRGRMGASAGLFYDDEDSEVRQAEDGVLFRAHRFPAFS